MDERISPISKKRGAAPLVGDPSIQMDSIISSEQDEAQQESLKTIQDQER